MASLKRKAPTSTENTVKKARSITSFFTPKPSAAGSSSTTPPSRFNKQAWVSSLTAEQKQLLTLEIETMHESWLAALKDELVTDKFLALKRFLENEKGTVYPPRNEIYSWSRYCPLNTVKVVILGQDPYRISSPPFFFVSRILMADTLSQMAQTKPMVSPSPSNPPSPPRQVWPICTNASRMITHRLRRRQIGAGT